ncbi:MAG TPA: formate hydrogenlyase, partial [Nitrososphaera sp.]|nr:formate hydrogenlyase [Nitrososphaera sp.]
MAESYFLLAATFIPLLLAPVAYVIGRRAGSTAVTWFSFGVLAVSTGLLFIPTMLLHGGMSSYAEDYKWGQFGDFGLKLDGLALPFALIIYVLCTVLALYSKPYMIHKIMEDMPGRPKTADVSSSSQSSSSTSPATSSHESHGHGGTLTLLSPEQKHYVNSQMGLYFGLYLAFSMGMLGTVLATNVIEFYVFFELML